MGAEADNDAIVVAEIQGLPAHGTHEIASFFVLFPTPLSKKFHLEVEVCIKNYACYSVKSREKRWYIKIKIRKHIGFTYMNIHVGFLHTWCTPTHEINHCSLVLISSSWEKE